MTSFCGSGNDPDPMTLNEYQRLARRTCTPEHLMDKTKEMVVYGLGISGEAGEVSDHIKKWFGHGHELDKAKVVKELGDTLWYIAGIAYLTGVTLEEVALANIRKLDVRYPDGFTPEASRNRVDE